MAFSGPSSLTRSFGDVAIEVVAAKGEAELQVASALMTDPAKMTEARRLGLRSVHFADEDLNFLMRALAETRDAVRTVRVFRLWMKEQGALSEGVEGDWSAGRWTLRGLASFACNQQPADLGLWVPRLIDLSRRLARARRWTEAAYRSLAGVKVKPMMGPINDAVWMQKAALVTGIPIELLATHVTQKRAGVNVADIPTGRRVTIPTSALAGGDKQGKKDQRLKRSA